MLKRIAGLCTLALFLAFPAQQMPYYQQFADYKITADVNAADFSYKGNQTLTYTNNSPDTLTDVYFHLYWNAFKPGSMMDQNVQNNGKMGDSRLQKEGISRLATIPKKEEGAQNIRWIRQNGQNLQFEVQETIMKVNLAQPIKPGTSTTFTMEWDAVVPMQIRRAGRNNREGIDFTMTQWYPKIAEYDYDGWATFDYLGREFHAPFANFDVNILIDKKYVVGAGGILENEANMPGYGNGTITANRQGKVNWHWTAKNILDFAWAADPDYSVEKIPTDGGPMVYFVYQKSPKTALWEPAKEKIKQFFPLMNAKFGQYLWPTYSYIQGGDGGMEYGMCTMILGEAKTLDGLVGLMAHESAHSWYQQMLATNESVRPWMDEGFTSYAESVAMHQLFPPANPKDNPFLSTLNSYRKFTQTGREVPAVYLADHHKDGTAYTYASYIKGELYLVQLGYIMGEEALSRTLKNYYNTWKLKHPTDRDFLHIAQQESGMDLKWFNHYWINTTKTVDYAVEGFASSGKGTSISFSNLGEVPMPVDFTLNLKNGQKRQYSIPMNMTRNWKQQDSGFQYTLLPAWPFTQKKYTATISIPADQITSIEIDETRRLADVHLENNLFPQTQK